MKSTFVKVFSLGLIALLFFSMIAATPVSAETGKEPVAAEEQEADVTENVNDEKDATEDSQTEQEEPSQADESRQPAEQQPATQSVTIDTDVSVDQGDRSAQVTAKVNDGNLAEGQFKMKLSDGTLGEVDQKDPSEGVAIFKKLAIGKHTVTITFTGKTNEGELVQTSKNVSFKVTGLPGDNDLGVTHEQIADNGMVIVKAEIPNADKAQGTWTFTMNGKTVVKKNVKGIRQQTDAFDGPIGKKSTVTVSFEGIVEGKQWESKVSHDIILVGIDMKVSCTADGVKVEGWLKGTKNAKGKWIVQYSGVNRDGKHTSKVIKGTRYSHVFPKGKLKPGEYDVFVDFEGQTDGYPTSKFDVEYLKVKKGDACIPAVTPGDNGAKPGDGKPESPTGQLKNGGMLPGTSVSYPIYMLVGGAILLLGVLTFFLGKSRRSH